MKLRLLLAFIFVLLALIATGHAQVSPQIQGAGAPTNPCYNGGQQYVDTTNHVLYGCPSSGSNWAALGIGNTQPTSIRSLASDPAACLTTDSNGTNNLYYNTTSSTFKYCSATNTWSAFGAGNGSVTSVATTSPITGGTITGTGTIACATCTTNAAALTSNGVMVGGGSNASAVSTVHTNDGTTETYSGTGGMRATGTGGIGAGANGGAAGLLTLFGSTSASTTFTENAAGTGTTSNGTWAAGSMQASVGNSSGVQILSTSGSGSASIQHFQELVTLNTGATTTDTAGNLLPANSIILFVTYRINTTITTAVSFTVGDGTTAGRFCASQGTLTAGTTGVCMVPWTSATAGTYGQVAGAKLRTTLNANPGAGVIRYDVFYLTATAPTS